MEPNTICYQVMRSDTQLPLFVDETGFASSFYSWSTNSSSGHITTSVQQGDLLQNSQSAMTLRSGSVDP